MNVIKLLQMVDVFPGMKTYTTLVFALGMVICQMSGSHTFSKEEWSAVGISAAIFHKMGQDRK